MKKAFILFVAIATLLSCTKQEQPQSTILDDFAAFALTRSDAAFEQSVWQHDTGEQFNIYLYFHGSTVSMFYGKVSEENGLERWSEFYDGSFSYNKDGIDINLSYPNYGDIVSVNDIDFLKAADDDYTLADKAGHTYTYFGQYTDELESLWESLTIRVPIDKISR